MHVVRSSLISSVTFFFGFWIVVVIGFFTLSIIDLVRADEAVDLKIIFDNFTTRMLIIEMLALSVGIGLLAGGIELVLGFFSSK